MPPGPNLVLVRQGAAFDGRSSRGLQAHPTESYHNMVAVVCMYGGPNSVWINTRII